MWFTASILFQSEISGDQNSPLWEERIILLKADSEPEAKSLAERYGRSAETKYVSATKEEVAWKVESILGLNEVLDSSLDSGAEVFSRFLDSKQVNELKRKPDLGSVTN